MYVLIHIYMCTHMHEMLVPFVHTNTYLHIYIYTCQAVSNEFHTFQKRIFATKLNM